MPQSARPGDVLADRYLLVDLLSESGGGRFWRAQDQVLERHVALHCIAADDERAARLTEAARLSATIHDRRLLRVLDADVQNGVAYVVNEWGAGTSIDILVAGEGPVAPRRAAWVVSEVAESMALAHEQRIAHGRLVPENVLLDHNGGVRVIGFCVDAALMGLPLGELSADVTDLGGLLYFLITGKWPGHSPSDVPPAPRAHDRWLRPRQVRAGIPRTLDSLCDQVLNPFDAEPSWSDHNLHTARGIADALREYVGDPTGLVEPTPLNGVHGAGVLAVPERREAAAPAPHEPESAAEPDVGEESGQPPPEPDPTLAVPAVQPPQVTPPEVTPPEREEGAPEPEAGPVADPPVPGDVPTQAGMPIFDDEADEVRWLEKQRTPPPPPPAFEEPPERPLFAPEPPDGGPVRRPRPGTGPRHTGEYWPWDTATGAGTGSGVIPVTEDDQVEEEVPGRSWFRLAALVSLSLLLLVAVVIAYNLGRGKTPLGAEPDSPAPQPTQTDEPSFTPIEDTTASDLDPQADPPEENPDLVGLAVDGDRSTAWRTSTYNDQLGPTGLKTGVGLYVDLGESREVTAIDLTTIGAPTDVTYYLTEDEPTDVADLDPLQQVTLQEQRLRTTLEEPATGRYLVVWLTHLPVVEDGFRAEIAEVVVSG